MAGEPEARRSTESYAVDAARRFLGGVARGDEVAAAVVADAYGCHPRHDTFPGEVYLGLGADALVVAGATVGEPICQDGLVGAYLPEVRYRGRDNAKIRYAVLACAARAGGLEVDLLDEVVWWGSDDYYDYDYAACAAVALIRAAADRLGVPAATVAHRLAERAGIPLAASPSGAAGSEMPERHGDGFWPPTRFRSALAGCRAMGPLRGQVDGRHVASGGVEVAMQAVVQVGQVEPGQPTIGRGRGFAGDGQVVHAADHPAVRGFGDRHRGRVEYPQGVRVETFRGEPSGDNRDHHRAEPAEPGSPHIGHEHREQRSGVSV